MTEYTPTIVCAANKCGDNIILGVRHWDATMRKHHVTFIDAGFSEGGVSGTVKTTSRLNLQS